MHRSLYLALLLPAALHGSQLPAQSCLRYRGGSGCHAEAAPLRPRPGALRAAARKLCTSPQLLAARSEPVPVTALARHMRGIVFGGMDGILTTFALLAAVAGTGRTSPALTLVIGISTVLADALSMGAGEYLSAKAEQEVAGAEVSADEAGPLEKGFAMFVAFTLFGAMPLLGFLLAELISSTGTQHFTLSIIITAVTLFTLGTVKSTFGAGVWWESGAEVTGIGGAAACVAFYTAKLVDFLVEKSGLVGGM